MVVTLLSSVQLHSEAMTDLICVKRGFPFTYIEINNAGNHVSLVNAFLNFMALMCVSCFCVFIWKLYREKRNVRDIFVRGICILSVITLSMGSVSYSSAASVKVLSWRLIRYGKMQYSCDAKHRSAVTYARNKWNDYKPDVISEGNRPDVVMRGSTELGLDLAGVTYSYGAIYFNDSLWDGFETSERRNCAMHEMGHALGLAHNCCGQAFL